MGYHEQYTEDRRMKPYAQVVFEYAALLADNGT